MSTQLQTGFVLPGLPYSFDALEPHIDARTMEIHHGKHHLAYVTNLNAALAGLTDFDGMSIEDLLKQENLDRLPADKRQAVVNHGGGHANHSLFWHIMAKAGGGAPDGELAAAIDTVFGSFTAFQQEFAKAAQTQFGSGWAWLVVNQSGKLAVTKTANQDSPISAGHRPILGLDVWEHAYYLNYQNRRPDYVTAWWNTVNWGQVADNWKAAK